MFSLSASSSPTVRVEEPTYTMITAGITGADSADTTKIVVDPVKLKQLKSALIAVPSAALVGTANKMGKRGKKKMRSDKLMNVAYNTVASRPIARRILRQPQITVELNIQGTAFTTSNIASVYAGFPIALNVFSNYTEYTQLFDQYKFEELEFWLEPFETQSNAVALSGTLSSCIDLDDGNTPTTIAGVQDHQGCVVTNGFAGHYHKWKPHMAVAVYSGAFTSFANTPANWIDAASPAVQHYGIKTAITATTAAVPYSYTVKALVSFRSPGI